MLDVLLAKIQPTDLSYGHGYNGYEAFPINNEPYNFKISVSNEYTLQFTVSKEYYVGSNAFYRMDKAIADNFGVSSGGHVVAIDKYPASQFHGGAKIDEQQGSGSSRYKIEGNATDFSYHSVILLVPGLEPIILADLNFAYGGVSPRGHCSSNIIFEKEAILSVKSPFGEVIGICLNKCSENALIPDSEIPSYTMSFEKVSLPPVILQKLLETKPQSKSETQEKTNE